MFTKPKNKKYSNSKRVSRKFKKRWRHILQGDRYDFLTLDQKLWFIGWKTNPMYNQFLINAITDNFLHDIEG